MRHKSGAIPISVTMEIDCKEFKINAPCAIYVHPNQVHRVIAFENVIVNAWAVNDENLDPKYFQLLEDITPATPMPLQNETFVLLQEAVTLCIKFKERKKNELYQSLLNAHINALSGLLISPYLALRIPVDNLSRAELCQVKMSSWSKGRVALVEMQGIVLHRLLAEVDHWP